MARDSFQRGREASVASNGSKEIKAPKKDELIVNQIYSCTTAASLDCPTIIAEASRNTNQ